MPICFSFCISDPCPLAPSLEFYDVTLHCPEHQGLKGEYVVQFSSPGAFTVWGMDGLLRWEWSLYTMRRIVYHNSTAQLEVEVGRFDLMYLRL